MCKQNCTKHKYHCGVCNSPLTYSPANYCSRPEDIPNECEVCSTCKTNTLDKCEKVKCKHNDIRKNEYTGREWCGTCFLEIKPATYPLNNKVKPEGVGEWKEELFDLLEKELEACYMPSGNARGECFMNVIIEKVRQLLLQEKAKWKGEVMKLMKNVVHIQDQPDFLAFKKDEVLTLIDKL